MKRLLFPCLLLSSLLSISAQEAKNNSVISSRIETLIANKLQKGSNVAISVYDLTDKKPLYAYQEDKLSRPASNMKLLTTITALSRPEADEPFRTEVWYKGSIERDTLRGDVYVVGGFDPEFDEEALDSLVASVARLPFSVIQGKLHGDVSMKDSLYFGYGWAWDDAPYSYQPYLSPLMLDKGVVTVTASPAAQGDTASLKVSPASTYFTLANETRSKTPSAGSFSLTRDWLTNGNNLLVKGNVNGKLVADVTVFPSQDFFMYTFAEHLQAKGVRMADSEVLSYDFSEFRRDSVSTLVGVYETPVQTVVKQIMKESDNLNAEALLYRMGVQATGKKHVSADDGVSAVRELVKKLGYNPENYKLVDGCGLSSYNYVSPELLVAFLRYAYSRTDVFQKLYKALPIGGVDGTLKNRMKKGTLSYKNVHAKTGSFTAINCLSGYLRAANGHQIAFSIMNQNALSAKTARDFQDAVCDALIKEW